MRKHPSFILKKMEITEETKCTNEGCKEKPVMICHRGNEEIPYCRSHGEWFMQLMAACF